MNAISEPEAVISHGGKTYEVWFNKEAGYDWVEVDGTDVVRESEKWFDSSAEAVGDIMFQNL